jgi:hypothetical protein
LRSFRDKPVIHWNSSGPKRGDVTKVMAYLPDLWRGISSLKTTYIGITLEKLRAFAKAGSH